MPKIQQGQGGPGPSSPSTSGRSSCLQSGLLKSSGHLQKDDKTSCQLIWEVYHIENQPNEWNEKDLLVSSNSWILVFSFLPSLSSLSNDLLNLQFLLGRMTFLITSIKDTGAWSLTAIGCI